MNNNIIIDGFELQPIHKRDNNRLVMGHRDLKDVPGVHYDTDGWLTSDQGRIYSTPSQRFVTVAQIEAVYPGMVPEHA